MQSTLSELLAIWQNRVPNSVHLPVTLHTWRYWFPYAINPGRAISCLAKRSAQFSALTSDLVYPAILVPRAINPVRAISCLAKSSAQFSAVMRTRRYWFPRAINPMRAISYVRLCLAK